MKLFTILLLARPIRGLLWLLFLFLTCFFGVHVAVLARLGWKAQAPKPPQNSPAAKEKPTPAPQEPIYYIVERKQRRKKPPAYDEPKQISFK